MVQDQTTNDIVSWSEKGDAFLVKKKHEFSQTILPKYFRTISFSSFVRQLNFYGFRKRSTNMSTTSYFKHKNFKRDQPQLLNLIKKKTSESSSIKKTVTELQKEVKQLKEQYKQLWQVQHQILFMLNNYVPKNVPTPLQIPGTPFTFPGGGIGPCPPPTTPSGGLDLNSLMLAHLNSQASAPTAMLGAPPVQNQQLSVSPGLLSSSNTNPFRIPQHLHQRQQQQQQQQQVSRATIQDVTPEYPPIITEEPATAPMMDEKKAEVVVGDTKAATTDFSLPVSPVSFSPVHGPVKRQKTSSPSTSSPFINTDITSSTIGQLPSPISLNIPGNNVDQW